MPRISTEELLAAVLDPDSWASWDFGPAPAPTPAPDSPRPESEYREQLARARERSGVSESVLAGSALIEGQPVAVVASDFNFLAGSIGRTAAGRIVAAFDRATREGLPVIGLPTSGGTRMQEGTPAFLLMAAIAGAVQRHSDAGLPYLVYLRHPTTGGVLATWGSLGDVTHAQPDALIGFLGPRVYEALYGEPFPADVQTGEELSAVGVIDAVASPVEWRGLVDRALRVWASRGAADRSEATRQVAEAVPDPVARTGRTGAGRASQPAVADGWDCIVATRRPDRPGVPQLIDLAHDVVELSGTQAGETAVATRLVLARFGVVGCVLVGQDRAAQSAGDLIGPADLRVARRGMALAERWGVPLLTVVDTQGGELSAAAERGAMAGEIARCLADLSSLVTPTLSVLLGGGGGGAALALLPADKVVAVGDSWVTPLPAEGASVIRHRTPDRAAEMARSQWVTATDLHRIGAVDEVLAPLGAGDAGQLAGVADAVAKYLRQLAGAEADPAARSRRWAQLRPGA